MSLLDLPVFLWMLIPATAAFVVIKIDLAGYKSMRRLYCVSVVAASLALALLPLSFRYLSLGLILLDIFCGLLALCLVCYSNITSINPHFLTSAGRGEFFTDEEENPDFPGETTDRFERLAGSPHKNAIDYSAGGDWSRRGTKKTSIVILAFLLLTMLMVAGYAVSDPADVFTLSRKSLAK